jgi:hypothetical protein
VRAVGRPARCGAQRAPTRTHARAQGRAQRSLVAARDHLNRNTADIYQAAFYLHELAKQNNGGLLSSDCPHLKSAMDRATASDYGIAVDGLINWASGSVERSIALDDWYRQRVQPRQ